MNDSSSSCDSSEKLSNLNAKIACAVLLFSVMGATVFGNVMLIFKVIRKADFQRKINVFVISLAVADAGVAVLVMLPSILDDYISQSLIHGSTLISKVAFAFDCMFTTSSILHFTCMNVDRFIAVSDPLKYFRKMTSNVVIMLIIICWISSSAISVTIVLLNSENVGCEYSLNVKGMAPVVGALLLFYMPLLLNIVAGVKIVLKVRNRNKFLCKELEERSTVFPRRQQHKLEARVTRTILILQGAFGACTTPFFLLLLLVNLFGIKASYTAWFVVAWFKFFNSTINPYLYYFLNKIFKNTDKNRHKKYVQRQNKK